MIIAPKPLSHFTLSQDELASDKKAAVKFGPCSLGKKALYLGGYLLNNRSYVPLSRVKRVYKRLAVTKGFFEGKIFGTLAYLVVIYDQGQEKVCRFEHEEDLNLLLNAIRNRTNIPVGKK